jgi:hypothetical protein
MVECTPRRNARQVIIGRCCPPQGKSEREKTLSAEVSVPGCAMLYDYRDARASAESGKAYNLGYFLYS